jgi:diadenosine tetraphosphate (Ap4A) HIT family hydrolase
MSALPESPALACPLCADLGGVLITQTPHWRVIRAVDENFPAFYRFIWQAHCAEFSELSRAERIECMDGVNAIERVLIDALQPTKINLAALGNVVPHLHWHVIARFDWDSHFPNPVWGAALRSPELPAVERLALPLSELDLRVRAALLAAIQPPIR